MALSKVLVVNKYHFISGGAERYFLSVMESFRRRGIEPIPLSVNYAKTLPTPYQKYFIEPVVKGGEAKIQNMKPTWQQQLSLAGRAVYSFEAKRAVASVIRDQRPDIAYFLNFNNHISPSAIDACVEHGVPVVMRMSDFNLSCPANMYYRDGHPCTDCKGSNLFNGIRHRCVHGSLVRSAVQVFANSLHRRLGIYKKVSAFIAPTEFMKDDLLHLGFEPHRVHQVNTFVRPCESPAAHEEREPYILFVGRFVPYKGVEAAIRAFCRVPDRGVRLHLAGDEQDAESARLKTLAKELGGDRIVFAPFERNKAKLHELVHKALFTLVPSECYDNLPNTILESFACRRPVIVTRLGSLPGIVPDGKLGLLFEYGDLDGFAAKIQWMLDHPEERERMGENAYQAVLNEYAEDRHMNTLVDIFEAALLEKKSSPAAEPVAEPLSA
ncbi:MAG TPA: glycosyltransferase family 4 protein [Verrucomicrobiae bacterium]|jgi:glycosyltransferase involved in cell wall biosynthesis|nr:glycosyltransferase family 4 protein [Verrucomicrobiae bacterium]